MRLFYTLLFYLLLPFVLLRLYWRGFKAPEYRKRWTERLAIYHQKYSKNVIWIHAVSVGEAEAVFPLIKRLQTNYPSDHFLVTTTTPTGSARVRAVLAKDVTHVYLPYDLPCVIKRFLGVFKPKIAIVMEKEIWPNLYAQCAKNTIPLIIINARLSKNSAKGYKKISALVKPALANVSYIATQTEDDKQRFIDIGATTKNIVTLGNIKFDLEFDEVLIKQAKNIRSKLFPGRFVWIIASTHEGEEAIFFEIYPQLKKQMPELLLMLVPRHPERFRVVNEQAQKNQLITCLRSTSQPCLDDTDVYLADTMGELKLLYGTADICFVGGSMVPVGGHNILEPAVMNVPIMFGPHMINFKQISNTVLQLNAAIQCANKEQIIKTVIHLYKNAAYRAELVTKASVFVKNNQGATEQTVKLISKIIE
jgi:3-deoxy-D-manno-octulosonic-acid transferase